MIKTVIKNIPLQFETDSTVFSPSGIDKGTLAMLSCVDFMPEDKLLDLGCGYGVVGLLAARLIGPGRVILCDSSADAVRLTEQNARLNGIENADIRLSDAYRQIPEKDFTLILSNPPYHTDFSVAKRFIETGFRKLLPGGRMYMVTKRSEWYKKKLTTVFGGVKIREIDGYYVFLAEKRGDAPADRGKKKTAPPLSKKLRRKYAGKKKRSEASPGLPGEHDQ